MAREFFQIAFPKSEKAELHQLAEQLRTQFPDITASQLARDAIREKMAKVKKQIAAKQQSMEAVAN